MRYDEKSKQTLALDGEPISKRALSTVRRYQRKSLEGLTVGEQGFCRLISPVVAKTKIRYAKQAIMYVTAGISFRLDFLFRDFKLCVEIDGSSHRNEEQRAKDEWRDRMMLELKGIRTIRFTNEDVSNRYMLVRARVIEALLASRSGHKVGLRECLLDTISRDSFKGQAEA